MAAPQSIRGRTLGHYQIVEQIGAGGMGVVYRARDERLERGVAVKVLAPGTLADESGRKRFRKEALALSRLNHPNIATVFDFDTDGGVDFLVTELIPGVTLDQKVAAGALPQEEVLQIAQQLADGLMAAHQQGVIHRDLKPGNLRLTPEGRLKILDFGLAKRVDPADQLSMTRSAADDVPAGTLSYMAPEQLRDEKVDARSDIWGAGVVLFELAVGTRPFQGNTAAVLTDSILHHPAPFELAPADLSPRLAGVISKCLEKDPEDRYQSAKELLEDVRPSNESSLSAVTATRRRTWLPRHAGRWGEVAGAALVLVAAAAMVAFFTRRDVPARNLVIQPLTSFSGVEWGASWSPDARFLAYAHSASGPMNVFVMPTSGGQPVQLTHGEADELNPRWSPDGRYIAFTSDRGAGGNIYLIPPLGGAERKLVELNLPWLERGIALFQALGAVPWSPDAGELLFSRALPTGEVAVCRMNVSTGAQVQITHPPAGAFDLSASWSYDGKRIAFERREGGVTTLWLTDPQGGEPEPLLTDKYQNSQPAWSADGKRVVFASNRSGRTNLWEIDLRSRRLRQLTSGAGTDFLATVSTTGKVAYSQYGHQVDLYWGRVDEPQDKHQRLTSNTKNNFGARVSPDGQQVLFHSDRTGNYDLWLLDRRTGSERQLTDAPGRDFMADWSPDGRQIVFLSDRGGSLQPWIMNLDSGQVRQLSRKNHMVTFEPHFSGPRWSPDGKAIASMAEGALWLCDPQGNDERSPLPGVISFDFYRDSRHILYTRKAEDGSGATEMRVADLESGKHMLLLRGPNAEMVASPDGREIAYVRSASHFNMQLYLLRLAPPLTPGELPRVIGEPRQLTHGEGVWHVHNGGWSLDGKSLAYTRDVDSGDIYVIENYETSGGGTQPSGQS